jgi:pimeloyl-ACP methyl ester carboxylesterase
MVAAAALFVAGLGTMLKYTENQTYLLYLLSDTIWTWQFSHRQRPEWDERIDRFAQYLVKVARASDADEIVIVGHSSGSFLGAEILARALKLDPVLGRHGPRIVFLTIGGNFPIVGFHAASRDFRDHLRQLAVEPSIDWIDCQSRKDVMNFFPFDPIAGHGIDVGANRRNPTIVPVRFREIIKPEHYNLFRWKFFRVHFQFVMANERPHAYDFFMIVCGPVLLCERMACPEVALAIATGDAAAREWAWKRLETAASARADAADLAGVELSARRSG